MGAQELSGQIEKKGDIWWAYCDQYPLAAHGKDVGEAIGNMVKMADLYLSAQAANQPKPKHRNGTTATANAPLRFALQAA